MIPSKYYVDELLVWHIKHGPTEHARRLERALLAWLQDEIDVDEFADVARDFQLMKEEQRKPDAEQQDAGVFDPMRDGWIGRDGLP